MEIETTQTERQYKLLSRLINDSVSDFNYGNREKKIEAAAFFRSDRCAWICEVVGGTVQDVIKNRLNGRDPFDMIEVLRGNDYVKNKPAVAPIKIEYNGWSYTVHEWADVMGIKVPCLRSRLKKWGVCKKTFREMK